MPFPKQVNAPASILSHPSSHDAEWLSNDHILISSTGNPKFIHTSPNAEHIPMLIVNKARVAATAPNITNSHDDDIPWGHTPPLTIIASPTPANLAEALTDLEDVSAYADEIEVEPPSQTTIETARRLLEAMCHATDQCFMVYPMQGGQIAIDARGRHHGMVMVICRADDSVHCMVIGGDNPREAVYNTSRQLPDGFLHQALAEL